MNTFIYYVKKRIKATGFSVLVGIKPGATNSGVTGPTSQIPGLCQSATDSAPAERSSGRRVGIFESDSDYVKLAKQGGHKGKFSVSLHREIQILNKWPPALPQKKILPKFLVNNTYSDN